MLWRVAIYGARRRVNEPLNAGVLRSDQHIDEAVDVDSVRSQGVVHRPGNRTKRRVVEDEVGARADGAACLEIANVTFHHAEGSFTLERTFENVVEICTMSGREIIDTDHCLAERQQLLKQVGADESGNASNDPAFGRRKKLFAKKPVRCGDHELTVEEYPPSRFRAVVRGSTSARSYAPHPAAFSATRGKASSIPPVPSHLRSISRDSTVAYRQT